MKIAISGSSGFIGTNLTQYFQARGHEVVALPRYFFTQVSGDKLEESITGADVVINLAGAPINHRWSTSYKQKMYESRIATTHKIVRTINGLVDKPKLFISTSAVGYYPTQGCFDESATQKGDGFLSDLCQQWEEEARKISPEVRLAITRFGVILAKRGGALPMMAMSMKFKVGTVIGPGSQPLPWMYIDDLMRAMEHIITDDKINGIVNFVSPTPTTNKELMSAMARKKKCLFTITIPQFFFKIMLGEASSFVSEGQCVIPQQLIDSGFEFEAPNVRELVNILYK